MNNFLYKLIGLIACIVIAAATAHAEDLNSQDKLISMLYHRESAEPLLQEGLKQFELESGYKVNLVFVNVNDLKQILIKGSFNNSLPDVVLAPSDFVSLAPIIKLSKLPSSLLSPDLAANALSSMQYQGDYYGAPVISGNHLMLFYNKKYVQHPAENWAELKAQAPERRAQGIDPIGWNYQEMYWFSSFATTFGGAPLTDGNPSLNSKPYTDALVFYKELADTGLIKPTCSYDCAQKDFQEELFAYAINGDWALADFERHLGDDLGISVIPAIGDKPFRPLFSTVGLMFPGNSLQGEKAKPLAALTLFLQSRRFQDTLFEKQRFLPVNQLSFKQVEAAADSNIKMLLKQLAQAVPMQPDPIMANAWIGMRKGFERYMAGISSAEEATEYMQRFTERDYQKSQLGQ